MTNLSHFLFLVESSIKIGKQNPIDKKPLKSMECQYHAGLLDFFTTHHVNELWWLTEEVCEL